MIKCTQYTGIIKTMPHKFIFREYGARRFIEEFYYRLNECDWTYFLFTMPSIPKYDVLHFYLLVDGSIRYRANIVRFGGSKVWRFSNRRTIAGKAWVYVTGPVVRAPFKIEMRGFRGFRYTGDLW